MNDKPNKTSPVLVIIALLLTVGVGVTVTSSTDAPRITTEEITEITALAKQNEDTQNSEETAEMTGIEDSSELSQENTGDSSEAESAANESTTDDADETASEETVAEDSSSNNDQQQQTESADTDTADQADAIQDDTAAQVSERYISPEAGTGIWTYANNSWYYMIDGVGYTGWLYDTDGHIYYFYPEAGYMLTGEQHIDGTTYYFDADGILQQ